MFKLISKLLGNKKKEDKKASKSAKEVTSDDIRNRETAEPEQETQPAPKKDIEINTNKNQTSIKKLNNTFDIAKNEDKEESSEKVGMAAGFKGEKDGLQEDDLKSSMKGLKTFISKSLDNLKSTNENSNSKTNSQLSTIRSITKDNMEINKDSLDVQKESLEEQKEAEYDRKHRAKESLKKAAGKVKAVGSAIIGKAKEGVQKIKDKGPKGILGMIAKLLGAAYLLKTFWPLIRDRVFPFVTDVLYPKMKEIFKETVWPWMKDTLFPFIKDNFMSIIKGIGIAALILKPIGTLKLAIKSVWAVSKLLLKTAGKMAASAAKFAIDKIKKVMGLDPEHNAKKADAKKSKKAKARLKNINKIKAERLAGNQITGQQSELPKKDAPKGKGKAGKKAGPMLKKAMKSGMKGLGKGLGYALKAAKVLTRFIPFLGIAIMAYDIIDTLFPKLFGKIGSFISDFSGKVWKFITDGFDKMGDWVAKKWDNLSELVAPIWDKVAAGIDKVMKFMMIDKLQDWLVNKFQSVMDVVKPAWDGVTGFIGNIADWYVGIWTGIYDSIKSGWTALTGLVKDLGDWFAKSDLLKTIKSGWSNLTEFIGNIGGWFTDKFKDVATLGKTIWSNITDGVGKLGSYVANKFADSKNIAEFGASIWTDVKDKFSEVADWIAGKFGEVKAMIEDKIWEVSPSIASMVFGTKKLTKKDDAELSKSAKGGDTEAFLEKVESLGFIDESDVAGRDSTISDKKEFHNLPNDVIQGLINTHDFSDEDEKWMAGVIQKNKDEESAIIKEAAKQKRMAANAEWKKQREAEEKAEENKINSMSPEEKQKYSVNNKIKENEAILSNMKDNRDGMDMQGMDTSEIDETIAKLKNAIANLQGSLGDIPLSGKSPKKGDELVTLIEGKAANDTVDKKLGLKTFATGGWTGTGKEDEVAGLVHKNEFVLTPDMLKELGAATNENDKSAAIKRISDGRGEKVEEQLRKLMEKREQDEEKSGKDFSLEVNDEKTSVKNVTKAQARDIEKLQDEGRNTTDFDKSEEIDNKLKDLLNSINNKTYENKENTTIIISDPKDAKVPKEVKKTLANVTKTQEDDAKKAKIVKAEKEAVPEAQELPKTKEQIASEELTGKASTLSMNGEKVEVKNLTRAQDDYLEALKAKTKKMEAAQRAITDKDAFAFDSKEYTDLDKQIDEARASQLTAMKEMRDKTWKDTKDYSIDTKKKAKAVNTPAPASPVKSAPIVKPVSSKSSGKATAGPVEVKAPKMSTPKAEQASIVSETGTTFTPEPVAVKANIPNVSKADKEIKSVNDIKESDIFVGKKLTNMNPDVEHNVKAMGFEYKEKFGKKLQLNSTGRSVKEQTKLYNDMLKKNHGVSDGSVASPGGSMHNYGLAIDAQSIQLNIAEKSGLMAKYGFHRPVHKRDGSLETWHMEPIGITAKDKANIRRAGKKANKKGLDVDKMSKEGQFTRGKIQKLDGNGEPINKKKVPEEGPASGKSAPTIVAAPSPESPVQEQAQIETKKVQVLAQTKQFDLSTKTGNRQKADYDKRFEIVPKKADIYAKSLKELESKKPEDLTNSDKDSIREYKEKLEYIENSGLKERMEKNITSPDDEKFVKELQMDTDNSGSASAGEQALDIASEAADVAMIEFEKAMNFMFPGEGLGESANETSGPQDALSKGLSMFAPTKGSISFDGPNGLDIRGESEVNSERGLGERLGKTGSNILESSKGLVGSVAGGIGAMGNTMTGGLLGKGLDKVKGMFSGKKGDAKAPQNDQEAKKKAQRINVYEVQKGDTLSEIAQNNNTTVEELSALNPKIKDVNKIAPGERILLPQSKAKAIAQEEKTTDVKALKDAIPANDVEKPELSLAKTETVKASKGDTLAKIALNNDIPLPKLISWNKDIKEVDEPLDGKEVNLEDPSIAEKTNSDNASAAELEASKKPVIAEVPVYKNNTSLANTKEGGVSDITAANDTKTSEAGKAEAIPGKESGMAEEAGKPGQMPDKIKDMMAMFAPTKGSISFDGPNGLDIRGESEVNSERGLGGRLEKAGKGALGAAGGLIGSIGGGIGAMGNIMTGGLLGKGMSAIGDSDIGKKGKGLFDSGMSKMKGLFGGKKTDSANIVKKDGEEIPVDSKAALATEIPGVSSDGVELVQTDRTGNSLKNVANAPVPENNNPDLEVSNKRGGKKPEVGVATKDLAKKSAERKMEAPKAVPTVINQITQGGGGNGGPDITLGSAGMNNSDNEMIGILF